MTPPAKTDSIADFLGWLGRQLGHITKAVKTDVTQPPPPADVIDQTLYWDQRVHEQPHPDQPELLLRRTIVDEVVLSPAESSSAKPASENPP